MRIHARSGCAARARPHSKSRHLASSSSSQGTEPPRIPNASIRPSRLPTTTPPHCRHLTPRRNRIQIPATPSPSRHNHNLPSLIPSRVQPTRRFSLISFLLCRRHAAEEEGRTDMVHCKQARRKPRGAADHAPRNGERAPGGAVAPVSASASLPGYMRPTSSSGSRAGRDVPAAAPASSAPLPEREAVGVKPVLDSRAPRAGRATCSSALKSGRLAHGGCGGDGRVCRYAYCSLKSHAPVEPLGTFVAARRRLIKTEQSMKHRGVSAFHKNKTNSNNGGLSEEGFFVQVYAGAGAKTASSGSSCSGLSTEESRYVTFGRRSCRDDGDMGNDTDVSVDGSCGSSDVISDGFAELVGTARHKDETDGEGEAWVDQEAEDSGACRSDISEELGARYQDHGSGVTSVDSSMDDISSAFGGMNFEDAGSDHTNAPANQRNKVTMSRRAASEEAERIRAFNPRAPNFLPVEPDPDAEKVDLRHQETDDRKNAEEWMVDYALRRTVKKLARAQKRKVEMLVQAFETVIPSVLDEKSSAQQDGDKKSFPQTRTWQPCS
uniref:Uncharacterized protein n=2 Tax=Avena sativa TaxID=4498 RepID=A0ACD5XDE4_AVESA